MLQLLNKLFSNFNPRKLAVVIIILVVVFSLPISSFFSNTFTRYWKINQKFDIANEVNFNDLVVLPEVRIFDFKITNYTSILSLQNFGIEPVQIGTISVRYYSICILAGVILGYLLALYLAGLSHISGNIIDRLLIGMVVFGLFGARLFFVIFSWESFIDKPFAVITEIGQGGMAIFGTVIACTAYVWLYCKKYKFNFFEFTDFLAPSLLVGQIIGRFGNYFNYEAYGPETSVWWKMYVPEIANLYGETGSKYFHPTFLYEIIPNICLLIYILWNYSNDTRKNSGIVFAKYAIGYGIIRSFCELFRLDSLKIYLPEFLQFEVSNLFKFEYIMPSQIAAISLFIFGIWLLKKRKKVIYLKKDMTELFV